MAARKTPGSRVVPPRRGGTTEAARYDSSKPPPGSEDSNDASAQEDDASSDEEELATDELDSELDPDSDALLEDDYDTELVEEREASPPTSRHQTMAIVPLRTSSALERRAADDPLATYMREVQRHPLLTREEEHELAVLYARTGDVDAAKRLVTSNLRLVVKIAYEYKRAYKNMMDLVQEGNIGLMHAVKRYDPERGVKLSSYSAWWIRAYILRFILNNWRLVKLGTTQAQRKLFFNLNKERARLSAMGIEPTHEEIAKRLDVSKKDVREMDLRLASGDASLDVPVGDGDGRQTTRLDLLSTSMDGPDQLVEDQELMGMLHEQLRVFRETLREKDREIFDMRMVAEDPLTLQELGDRFGVSRERVRQLEARISKKLKAFLTECLGEAVVESHASQ